MKAKQTLKAALGLFVILIGIESSAQQDRYKNTSPEDIFKKQSKHIVEKLKLDDNQAQQLEDISVKYGTQIRAISASKEDVKQKREKVMMLKHEQSAEVKTLLNDEDFGKYLLIQNRIQDRIKMKKKAKAKRKAMEKLNLSKGQKQQLNTIRKSYREQFMSPLEIGFERFEENIWKI